MSAGDFPILPSTKIAALLDRYPELEDILIGLAPPFRKLKNPMLRRSVAKVASLRQAAAVGRIPVEELVNTLRASVGQEAMVPERAGDTASYFSKQPEWFNPAKIVASIDERGGADPSRMPVLTVLHKARLLEPAEIVELITTFLPAPGIDLLRRKGFLVWSAQEEPELIRTYVSKPSPSQLTGTKL